MVKKNYQMQLTDESKIAKAMAKNVPISVKYSTELCNYIKGKSVKKVLRILDDIIAKKQYLPLLKYRKKVAHRKGKPLLYVKSGRYPVNVCKAFKKLINSAINNAVQKGLNEEKLYVLHAFASIGYRRLSTQPKGRIAGKIRRKKSTHIEVILAEKEGA